MSSTGVLSTPPSVEERRPLLSGDDELRARARALVDAVLDGFKRNDLLTYASAISFQILTAIVPFLLFVLALAELLNAQNVWTNHLAPSIQQNVSPVMFNAIQGAVKTVFTHGRILWATGGGLLAIWEVSGVVRAVMGALGRIYEAPGERPFLKRFTISFILTIEVGLCFILIIICLLFAPFFWNGHHHGALADVSGFVVRWLLVVYLLFAVVALLVRHAPSRYQTVPWVTTGAAIVIGSWIVASFAFYFYLTEIASYQSVFAGLADLIVAFAYLYVSTITFLFGAQLDAIIRAQATGCAAGTEPQTE